MAARKLNKNCAAYRPVRLSARFDRAHELAKNIVAATPALKAVVGPNMERSLTQRNTANQNATEGTQAEP
jgi:hypothetical protein